jgi:hypothetical protein
MPNFTATHLRGLVGMGLVVSLILGSVPVHTQVTVFQYSEKTLTLPNFNPLHSKMLVNSAYPYQWPVLGSRGIYYVDNSDKLDEVLLSNGTVRTVAPITPVMAYGYSQMVDNQFFLEDGYDEALFYGTPSYDSLIVLELVNLTTGSTLLWKTGWPSDPANQQANYVGHNTVVVTSSNGSMEAFDLVTRTQWRAGHLPFFEANNLYWIPQLREFINVQADKSWNDSVQQLDEAGNGFVSVAQIRFANGIEINWVDGIAYNASYGDYGAIAFTGGDSAEQEVDTWLIPIGPGGTLNRTGIVATNAYNTPAAIEGQDYSYTGTYVLGSCFFGTQYLYNPWNQTSVPTNIGASCNVPDGNGMMEGTVPTGTTSVIDFHKTLEMNDPTYSVVYAYPAPMSHGTAGQMTAWLWLGLVVAVAAIMTVMVWKVRRVIDR